MKVAELLARYGRQGHAELAMRVAIGLGPIVSSLHATNAVDARLVAEARALYVEGMRS